MLAIYKAVNVFTIIIVMRHRYFYIITRQVNNRIADLILVRLALQQIKQTVFAYIGFAVEDYFQSCIQEAIVPDLVFQKLGMKLKVLKHRFIRDKSYQRSI